MSLLNNASFSSLHMFTITHMYCDIRLIKYLSNDKFNHCSSNPVNNDNYQFTIPQCSTDLDVQHPYFFPNACCDQPICKTEADVLDTSQIFTNRYSTAVITGYLTIQMRRKNYKFIWIYSNLKPMRLWNQKTTSGLEHQKKNKCFVFFCFSAFKG